MQIDFYFKSQSWLNFCIFNTVLKVKNLQVFSLELLKKHGTELNTQYLTRTNHVKIKLLYIGG